MSKMDGLIRNKKKFKCKIGKIKFKTNYNKKSNFVIKILEIELEANLNVTQFHNVITHVVYDNSC